MKWSDLFRYDFAYGRYTSYDNGVFTGDGDVVTVGQSQFFSATVADNEIPHQSFCRVDGQCGQHDLHRSPDSSGLVEFYETLSAGNHNLQVVVQTQRTHRNGIALFGQYGAAGRLTYSDSDTRLHDQYVMTSVSSSDQKVIQSQKPTPGVKILITQRSCTGSTLINTDRQE